MAKRTCHSLGKNPNGLHFFRLFFSVTNFPSLNTLVSHNSPSVCNNPGYTKDTTCFKDLTDPFKNACPSVAENNRKQMGLGLTKNGLNMINYALCSA